MINKKIENGFYDVIATIKIDCGDSRNGIDLDKFLAQIIAIKKRFAHLTLKKVGFIGIGFDYAVANVIQLKGDDDQLSTSILISNIDDAKINLNLRTDESADIVDFSNQSSLIRSELIGSIVEATKIVGSFNKNIFNYDAFNSALSKTTSMKDVKALIDFIHLPSQKVIIDDEVFYVGGVHVPKTLSTGQIFVIKGSEILKVGNRGDVIIDACNKTDFQLIPDNETQLIKLNLSTKDLNYSLFAFAFASKIAVSLEVSMSKEIITGLYIYHLVRVLNTDVLIKQINESFDELAQKLEIV